MKLFNCDKQYYFKNFRSMSPEYQPDGRKSAEKAVEHIRQVLAGKKTVFEWMHQKASGEVFPVEITLARVKRNNRYVAIAYMYDLSNIRRIERLAAEAQELADAIKKTSPIAYLQ